MFLINSIFIAEYRPKKIRSIKNTDLKESRKTMKKIQNKDEAKEGQEIKENEKEDEEKNDEGDFQNTFLNREMPKNIRFIILLLGHLKMVQAKI